MSTAHVGLTTDPDRKVRWNIAIREDYYERVGRISRHRPTCSPADVVEEALALLFDSLKSEQDRS